MGSGPESPVEPKGSRRRRRLPPGSGRSSSDGKTGKMDKQEDGRNHRLARMVGSVLHGAHARGRGLRAHRARLLHDSTVGAAARTSAATARSRTRTTSRRSAKKRSSSRARRRLHEGRVPESCARPAGTAYWIDAASPAHGEDAVIILDPSTARSSTRPWPRVCGTTSAATARVA